ncbi:LuxR C-terminal-related transcriptional regulator [Nocardioides zeae]
MRGPLRLALVNDYEVVVAGLTRMLAPYAAQVRVVEIAANIPVSDHADLVLFDTFAQSMDNVRVEDVAPAGIPVVAYTWQNEPDVQKRALAWGAVACLSKTLSAARLVAALEDIRRGGSPDPGHTAAPSVDAAAPEETRDWPGRSEGLTERESEVMALLAAGHSNQEIAELLHVSINSVKTYLRHAYRKAEVNRRSQAVLWALDKGFTPDVLHRRVRGR